MKEYNWGLMFSCCLLCLSGFLALCGNILDAVYAAVVACWWWVVFDA
jgi:hypothetical protein